MKAKNGRVGPVKKSRNERNTPGSLSDPDLEASVLAQIQEVERLGELLNQLPNSAASSASKPGPQFLVSLDDAKATTACAKANIQQPMRWLFNSVHGVLSAKVPSDETIPLLETIRAILLNSEPKTPVETMLISQAMASHHLAMKFSEWAINAMSVETSTRLAEKAARFMELACREAETIQKLRGSHQQRLSSSTSMWRTAANPLLEPSPQPGYPAIEERSADRSAWKPLWCQNPCGPTVSKMAG